MSITVPLRTSGLTRLEVLMTVAVFLLLAAVSLVTISHQRIKGRQIRCANNLKMVGISFTIWYSYRGSISTTPMRVSFTNGGSMEFISTPQTFRHFQVMSNELGTPKLLVCPADSARKVAPDFPATFSNTNLSYFVGVDAIDTMPEMFLSGDRNITNGAPGALLTLTTNRPAGWTAAIHVLHGNICTADGSVQSFATPALQAALGRTGVETNRLAMP